MAKNIDAFSKNIKKLILIMSHEAHVGHIGSALSIADIISVLYFKTLRVYPKNPKANNRDRFILSKGHAVAALYAALYLRGFITKNMLDNYCKNGGLLGEHPERHISGVELSTGSLGHGLSFGAGIALGAKIDKKKFHTWVLVSDAECNEGQIWEAAAFIGHHKLNNLTVIIDNNHVQAFGKTRDVLNMEPFENKWSAFGWKTLYANGHDTHELTKVLSQSTRQLRPSVVIAETVRGNGVSFMEHKIDWHYLSTTNIQHEAALSQIDRA